ncbi:MAG: hypothetical protein ACJ77M_00500 [Thermoleophilaceae bacterium]|jgi:hypothetical protein
MSQQQPSEEELRAALEEEMRRLTPQDVIVQSVVTLVNLAGRKLGLGAPKGDTGKDLEQARTAIEAVRALLPLVPEEPAQPIRDALSQLQIAYVRETQDAPEGAEEPSRQEPAPEQSQQAPDDAERAKARAKIWTPPGS